MKTIEPSFAVLLVNLYPIIARYKTYVIENNELKEVDKIIMQFNDRVIESRSDQVTILNLDQVKGSIYYKNKLEYFKFVLLLDDKFYPDSEIVRIGLSKSIEDTRIAQSELLAGIDTIKGIKWPTYKEVESYIVGSPRDYIKLVER